MGMQLLATVVGLQICSVQSVKLELAPFCHFYLLPAIGYTTIPRLSDMSPACNNPQ